MAKKNEIPVVADKAEIIKPADLVAENIPPAEPPPAAPEPAPEPTPAAPPVAPKDVPQPVETTPAPPVATVVTASQLVADQIPTVSLPPLPGGEKRGRGRPPGQKNKPKAGEMGASQINMGDAPENSEQLPTPEQSAVNYRQLAEISFDLTTNTMAGLVGPEWRATDPAEREAVLKPLEVYFASKKMEDIPPGAVLCFALASYAAVRMRAPATRSKIAFAWSWLKYKISGKRDFTPRVVNNGNPFAEKS